MKINSTGKLLDYKDFVSHSEIFIETGTCQGDGVQRAIDAGYNIIKSCEAKADYYMHSLKRFNYPTRTRGVILFLGKSVDVLPKMLTRDYNCVIYLDAHPAGPESFGHDQLMNDPGGDCNQDNIIKAELKIVLESSKEHTIIIDDVNGMADGHAQEYADMMLQVNPNYCFYFYDENLGGTHFYKDKLMVAIPY